jgi:hypothetical protein
MLASQDMEVAAKEDRIYPDRALPQAPALAIEISLSSCLPGETISGVTGTIHTPISMVPSLQPSQDPATMVLGLKQGTEITARGDEYASRNG